MNLEDSQTQIIQEMSSSNESEQNEKIESKDEQSNNELDITDRKEKKKKLMKQETVRQIGRILLKDQVGYLTILKSCLLTLIKIIRLIV